MSDIQVSLGNRFHKSSPYISVVSLLAVLGLFGFGQFSATGPTHSSASVNQQILDQMADDHAQIRENVARLNATTTEVAGLKSDNANVKQELEFLRQGQQDLDYKTTRILELMLQAKDDDVRRRGQKP